MGAAGVCEDGGTFGSNRKFDCREEQAVSRGDGCIHRRQARAKETVPGACMSVEIPEVPRVRCCCLGNIVEPRVC